MHFGLFIGAVAPGNNNNACADSMLMCIELIIHTVDEHICHDFHHVNCDHLGHHEVDTSGPVCGSDHQVYSNKSVCLRSCFQAIPIKILNPLYYCLHDIVLIRQFYQTNMEYRLKYVDVPFKNTLHIFH